MDWPIGTPVSKATRRLNEDIVDLAADSTALKRENATLRRKLDNAERALAQANEILSIVRDSNSMAALQIAQMEKLAVELKRAAVKHPHQPLSRWVKFGPMAILLASIKDQ
ncbi:hypothetical protein [Cupriavidus nantongensis]|uniref:Uncharacterized protein n=1 Tax=Cupriavidus nantongensis TaxID=1796606 RepID=A0A142JHR8_9BURK|nr:hypothetical protein [Cupriavidus nantongensis]AMR77630.1 hypothetical protein A2G96_07720 [Cupriavidus nantongensis]